MFKIILVSVLLGLAAAAVNVNSGDSVAEIRSFANVPADAEGNFAYSFDTTNGISAQESGNIAGVTGSIQYISPEGIPIQITFTADQDGYHPVGEHLPTPPPVPEPILRAIAYNLAHPQKDEGRIVVNQPYYQPQESRRVPTIQPYRKSQFSG